MHLRNAEEAGIHTETEAYRSARPCWHSRADLEDQARVLARAERSRARRVEEALIVAEHVHLPSREWDAQRVVVRAR